MPPDEDIICPGPDCLSCSGEACDFCGAGCWNNSADFCEHDCIERHTPPPKRDDKLIFCNYEYDGHGGHYSYNSTCGRTLANHDNLDHAFQTSHSEGIDNKIDSKGCAFPGCGQPEGEFGHNRKYGHPFRKLEVDEIRDVPGCKQVFYGLECKQLAGDACHTGDYCTRTNCDHNQKECHTFRLVKKDLLFSLRPMELTKEEAVELDALINSNKEEPPSATYVNECLYFYSNGMVTQFTKEATKCIVNALKKVLL